MKPFEIQRFGGWVQKADAHEIGWSAATDLSNVDLDDDGRLRTRDGSTDFDTGPTGTRQLFVYKDTTNYDDDFLLMRYDGGGSPTCALYNADSNTTYATSFGDSDTLVTSYCQIGTSTASNVVFARSNGRVMKWEVGAADIANLSTDTRPKYVARTPRSDRLAIANFSTASYAPGGSGGSPSTVWFSEAPNDGGSIETFPANNDVHLAPGDGEQITGMASFRDLLFVFKQTKMFVMYGESIGADGSTPEFNFREVTLPCSIGSSLSVAVGVRGVYFAGTDGVYVTTGGSPESITDSSFDKAYWQSTITGVTSMTVVGERVYLDASISPNRYVFVYDIDGGYWLKWTGLFTTTYGNLTLAGAEYSRGGALHFLAGNDIRRIDPTATTDDGTAIAASYTTGRQAMSPPGSEGVLREVLLDGTGTVTCNVNVDGTDQTSASVTPTAASIGRYRKAARGRTFQLKLSSSSGAWSLSRVVGNVQPGRPVGAS